MGHLGDQVVAILTAIIGVAILAVIVSKNSATTQVIGAGSQFFTNALGTALSPINGGGSNLTLGPVTGFSGRQNFTF